ncbi:MAG: AIR carboxylase family protein [Candidatus Diapherotrites archaeon]|uniref:N5-carboxyaminoimidazole ribonucleotide mutase n=1 Tax=Candidatus Iainarchaeum sp. TaxID=3101447 RepID=A0A939C8Y4_9ARCH|nr:AIR carboxylase family protein [Candidatus Diapherotrites archaeon]
MADVLVVFGSKSDEPVYSRVMSGLKENSVSAELHICSAHRTPKELDALIESTSAKIIIAGAGLSAALPGVVASKTAKPVIGVPVSGAFAGLDALLSTVQMPKGYPVITTGVGNAKQAVEAASLALKSYGLVKVTGNKYNQGIKQKIDSIKPIANKLGLSFEFIETVEGNFDKNHQILVNVVELAGFSSEGLEDCLALNVPVLKESSTPEALELFEKTKHGLWIGLNRVENAFIAAAQLMNANSGAISGKLKAYREELAKSVLEDDSSETKKFKQ